MQKKETAIKREKTVAKKVTAKKSETEKKISVATAEQEKVVAKKEEPKKVVVKNITNVNKQEVKKVEIKEKVTTAPLPKINVERKKRVIFVGSEAAPFIATGGLADVLGSLPKAIAKNDNFDVSVMLPLYSNIKEEYKKEFKFLTNFNVAVGWRLQYCGVFYYEYQGVKFYFIDNEYYFKREGSIYGFYDDGERFAFFSRAVLDTMARLDIYPDIINANDWQTAGTIIYLKGMYYGDEKFRRIKTIFTIHNIEYQGKFDMFCFSDLFGFPNSIKNFVELDGCVNLMKGAIEMSDVVSTVSPTYAEEIKNSYFAHGLEDIVNRNSYKLRGILNGIDIDYYNPETDKFIFKNYSLSDLSGKKVCKLELQKMLGFYQSENTPIVAVISRLVSHKGLDLIRCKLEELLSQDVQVIILGKGEVGYENYFCDVANRYKGKCACIIAYNQELSRKIYSGADIFLMPSKMEPCGLSQMIASRYGTVPIVRETGGLNDSIKSFAYGNADGNGFTFHSYNADDMLFVIKETIKTYHNKESWDMLIKNVMEKDFSWNISAKEYEKMYNE